MASPNGIKPAPTSQFFTSSPSKPQVPRLAISAEGLEKRGKTHWAVMTAPDPLAIVYNDLGTENIIQKARAEGRKIIEMKLEYDIPDPAIIAAKNVDAEEHASWIKEWTRFKLAMASVESDKTIRTLVWDTGTEIKNLCELSHFGKLKGNARMDLRTTMNSDFSRTFWNLYNHRPDLNLILIHKLGKEYKKGTNPSGAGEWTGNYERKGFGDIGYMVDLSLRFEWDKYAKDFYTQLDETQATRFGTENIGTKWYAKSPTDPSAFWNLAMAIFPETESTPEYWGVEL